MVKKIRGNLKEPRNKLASLEVIPRNNKTLQEQLASRQGTVGKQEAALGKGFLCEWILLSGSVNRYCSEWLNEWILGDRLSEWIPLAESPMVPFSLFLTALLRVSTMSYFYMVLADRVCSKLQEDLLCNLTLDDEYFEIVNTTWLHANSETCTNGSEIYVPHQGPSEQYWDKVALHRTSSMDETGEIVWYLALCLLLACLIVGTALSKGIKSSGKVVYFTATFPYVVLIILLIRGVTLEGAYKGIEYYIGSQSDFSKLADAEVWKDAAIQIFFSSSVGAGNLITLSSCNKFHNNCYRDTIIVCVVNCATSVFAGFAIFSILGHMAHVQNKPVSEVVLSGFGLAFIVYPEALGQLPWAPLWSILFFFMLITLGLDTQFASLETIITTLQDQFPKFLRSKHLYLTIGICLLFYFLGLMCVTQAVLFWSLATFASPTYGPVEYPVWATALGWCMIIFSIMWIPIVAIVRIAQAEGSTLCQPDLAEKACAIEQKLWAIEFE
ncbi:sodium- and chloride-dependent neutral and basic amino acid transporter B(0+)-like [Heptranchias perlo]|uniref:sodium- and chloride-dependent neutral and basic amino acid transporter B(0+)-like n=1 Tax=Heptranchias perlo TaxID=212740 RepID=UPI00355AC7F8